ncbi:MAG: PKD domain-containing protein [Actinobacteria bacterium]|nr:PKD domain-containing protein [Actinomycetota bacterium]
MVDPAIEHLNGYNTFLANRILVKSCDQASWLEIGWAEVDWRPNAQYIYSFNTVLQQWQFFGQYPVSSGSRIWVTLISVGNNVWEARLWWNGAWQTLVSVTLPSGVGCGNEDYVEVYNVEPQVPGHFPFPLIAVGDGSSTGMNLLSPGNSWISWDVPSSENNDDGTGGIKTTWNGRYYSFTVTETNRPPRMVFNVSPSVGQVNSTSFSIVNSWVDDPDGNKITYQVFWGDGTHTAVFTGTYSDIAWSHKYSTTGYKTISITATDYWYGGTTNSARQVRVCTLVANGQCVVA